jgi:hypothetical protein
VDKARNTANNVEQILCLLWRVSRHVDHTVEYDIAQVRNVRWIVTVSPYLRHVAGPGNRPAPTVKGRYRMAALKQAPYHGNAHETGSTHD